MIKYVLWWWGGVFEEWSCECLHDCYDERVSFIVDGGGFSEELKVGGCYELCSYNAESIINLVNL